MRAPHRPIRRPLHCGRIRRAVRRRARRSSSSTAGHRSGSEGQRISCVCRSVWSERSLRHGFGSMFTSTSECTVEPFAELDELASLQQRAGTVSHAPFPMALVDLVLAGQPTHAESMALTVTPLARVRGRRRRRRCACSPRLILFGDDQPISVHALVRHRASAMRLPVEQLADVGSAGQLQEHTLRSHSPAPRPLLLRRTTSQPLQRRTALCPPLR